MSPPLPETPRWDRRRTPPDRSSSSAPAHRRSSPRPDTVRPLGNSEGAGWSIRLPPPVSSPGSAPKAARRSNSFYPIPTHSRHSLIALLSTAADSPRQTPKHTMATPASSRKTCKAAFSLWLMNNSPSVFCHYHSAGQLNSPLRIKT